MLTNDVVSFEQLGRCFYEANFSNSMFASLASEGSAVKRKESSLAATEGALHGPPMLVDKANFSAV